METMLKKLTIDDKENNNPENNYHNDYDDNKDPVPSTSNMAIKNLAMQSDDTIKYDLVVLAQYIKSICNQPDFVLPPPLQLLHDCQEIVRHLANSKMSHDSKTLYYLRIIEDYLVRTVTTVHPDLRKRVIDVTMNQLFDTICVNESEPCAFAALVFVVFDVNNLEMLETARGVVEMALNADEADCLGTCLANLYRWCCQWQGSAALGQFVTCFIKALEEQHRYDILMTVSLYHMERLFLVLDTPCSLRLPVSEVVFHVLASCRFNVVLLDKIAPHVGNVLSSLATDSSQWSRQLLQHVVDILSAIVESLSEEPTTSDADVDVVAVDAVAVKNVPDKKAAYREKYADVVRALEMHMASGDCQYLQRPPWKPDNGPAIEVPPLPQKKAGLSNLGNTCYMNSVLQALLATKQFSNSVILYKENRPYWSRLCDLFTKMHHSLSCKLNPYEFFQVIKPPYFIPNSQHDSSEFLVYMFETLQCYEFHSEYGFDYSNPPPRVIPNISMVVPPNIEDDFAAANAAAAARRRAEANRAESPMPGSSTGITGHKRSWPDDMRVPLKKRQRREPKDKQGKSKNKSRPLAIERDSLLDQLFGGVMITRLQCGHCSTCSFSRDVFRDLQLGFPDKLDTKHLSVQFLIEHYCSEERLCGENRYRCPICMDLQDAERSVLIEVPPKYLIIVLKNFRYEPKLQIHNKLMLEMHYDLNITLPIKGPKSVQPKYHLYAGVVHSGSTLDSGHYFTLAHDGQNWHEYNDDIVTRTSEHEINSLTDNATPYILFYRRSDVHEPAPPTFDELCPSLRQMLESHHKHVVDAVQRFKTTQATRP